MGDPRRFHKKYTTPAHMWQGTRIADESKLKKEFGLKNNKEVWRANAFVGTAREQARNLIGKKDQQGEAQRKLLVNRLVKLGIVSKGATISDVLGIKVHDVLGRRLQTIIKDKGIARTPKEARQMIVHGQVKYGGRKHKEPGTLVPIDKADTVAYIGPSRMPRPPKKKEPQGQDSPSLDASVKPAAGGRQ